MTKQFDVYIANSYTGEVRLHSHRTLTISPATPEHSKLLHRLLDDFLKSELCDGEVFECFVTDIKLPVQTELF